MSENNLIIYDFDGVFNGGSTEAYETIIHQSLDEAGADIPSEDESDKIKSLWGTPPELILISFVKDNPAVLKTALALYRKYMRNDFPDMIVPIEGSREALQELSSEHHKMALNTSADKGILLDAVMPRLGIKPEWFNGGITAAQDLPDGRFKPDPFAINDLVKKNDVTKQDTIMVGDSGSDVLSAHLAGVEPVVTLTGNLTAEEALNLQEVRHVIETVADLPALVHRTLGWASIGLVGYR